MKTILFGLFLLAVLLSCNKEGQQAPPQIEKVYVLTGFFRISVAENITLNIHQGPAFRIKGRGTEGDLNDLILETDADGTLVFRYAVFRNIRYGVHFDITLPALSRISAGGVARVSVTGFAQQATPVRVTVGGRATCTIEGLPELLKVEGSEAAVVNLSGSSPDLLARLSGEARLYGYAASFADADLLTEGKAMAYVSIRHYLSAIASGESRIYYKGNPPGLYQETSGKAKVIAE
jgi:hypothetical protein